MPLFKKDRNDFSGSNAAGYDGKNANFNNQRYDNAKNNAGGVGAQHHHDPFYPSPDVPSNTQSTARGAGGGAGTTQWDDRYDGGYGAQPGTGAGMTGNMAPGTNAEAAEYPMRPQTDASGNPINPARASGGGGGKRMEGKVERVVGTMVGSQNLKAKGLAKEQEAAALKAQAAELNEAERLEQAALARRERAVAHGAHPDHRHLGSHNPVAGAPNINELGGGGANYGISGAGGASSAARGGY